MEARSGAVAQRRREVSSAGGVPGHGGQKSWSQVSSSLATVSRSEWFVDDEDLNTLLRDSGRSAGIVRAPGLVRVNPEAIDPWPERGAE